MNKVWTIAIALWVLAAPLSAATPFRTALLERIARAAGVRVADSIPANTFCDSVAFVRGKEVYMRTNAVGDVAHLGYRLFNRELIRNYQNDLLFEFVERYLLELDLGLDSRGAVQRMHVDQVTMVKGTLDMLRKVTPQTNLSLTVDEVKRKMYRLTWKLDEGEVCMTVPANSQLILGANAIELEQMVLRDVPRMMTLTGDDIIQDWSGAQVTKAGRMLIVKGGIYMSQSIRGDLYLTEHKGNRQLVCSPKSATRSVSNIMLTGIADRPLPMRLTLNEYGNRKDSVSINLQQWMAYGQEEQCKFYFGVKSKNEDVLTGTLFAYNEKQAYVHMLSVEFPLSLLTGSSDPIRATAYVYIPLQHIGEKYFIEEFNPTLYDED